ncbi:hypothetical protein FG379_001438 [Cryptosporidium bovis]|uniref:uncharacterized protein n=1 Tax=Cryptosporidium bovis TaxID=310047 RepID=UPI00351A5448|nr:hypothetical protein FG379_001438 [Cryptosporidium bovis]
MENTNINSFGGFGINNSDAGISIFNNNVSGTGNGNSILNNNYQQNNYGGISNAIQHDNIQQFHFSPGIINNGTNNTGIIQNNGITPGINCLFPQQLITGNPQLYPYLYNNHLNNPLFSSSISSLPQHGINKGDGFVTGIENQDSLSTVVADSGIKNVSEDEDKSGRLKAAAAAQMIMNEINKNRFQSQLVYEGGCVGVNSSTGKNCAIGNEGHAQMLQRQLQFGGVVSNNNSLNQIGTSGNNDNNINGINACDNGNINNNQTLVSSFNTGEDANLVAGGIFGHGLVGNNMAIPTPFGLFPFIPKLCNYQIQDQIQNQYYQQLLQEQLQQVQRYIQNLQNLQNSNFVASNDLPTGEIGKGGKNDSNASNIFGSSINLDTNKQKENGSVQATEDDVKVDANENKEERVPLDLSNPLVQQQIQQMVMAGAGVTVGNQILGGTHNNNQSQQNIYHQMHLYSLIQRQMLQKQQQIKELALNSANNNQQIKNGVGAVPGSVSIPIKGVQAMPNIQNSLGLQQLIASYNNKAIGSDLQITQGFNKGSLNYNSELKNSGNITFNVNSGSALAIQNNGDNQYQTKYVDDPGKSKTNYYDPAIGDELRAVLGLSASAIRGIKTNKNTQGKVGSGVDVENNVSNFGEGNNNCTSRNIIDSLDIDGIEFGKLKDTSIEHSLRNETYERKSTAQNSRKAYRKISNRGISKNSSKHQASNLLSIIENEQLSKMVTGKARDENSKNMIENIDVTNNKTSSIVNGDKTRSNNSDHFVSQNELNRIEYLHFTVETIPTLVKDYIPSFSGKFAFIPLPSICDNANNGKQYTSNSSSSISASSIFFNWSKQNDIDSNTGSKKTILGLRSRRNKIVSSINADDSNVNTSSSRNLYYSSLNNDKLTTKNCDISSKLPKFLLNVLRSIRLMGSKDGFYCIKDVVGLKMVAKEKLTSWMDMPCDMNKKKAKTGLGPNTRESLRKELKKQGEFFRLVSTKDEFLCDTKMINNYNPRPYICHFSTSGDVDNESGTTNNTLDSKLECEKGLLNNGDSILIKQDPEHSKGDFNNCSVNDNNFTPSVELQGVVSTSVSSSTIGAGSPARWMSSSLPSTDNSDLSSNRSKVVINNEHESDINFRAQ